MAVKMKGVDVYSNREHFGKGTADEEFIPKIAQQHGILITLDYHIHRIEKQAALCRENKIGVFFFRPPKKQPLMYWDIIRWCVNQWGNIISLGKTAQRPFSYEIRLNVRDFRLLRD